MENIKKTLTNPVLISVLILIPACWALFVPGFYGASDDIHIAWLYELHKTIATGQIPPRFVPDLSFGFGYPLFNFVFPLPFYLAEVFHLLGLSLVDSVKMLFFLSLPLSFWFMYLLIRQFSSRVVSLAGAVLYVYTPYRSVDLYIRGAIGEVLSFVFLPLVILSIIKISQSNNKWIGVGALSFASLVLSHNITAYMFLPFAGLFFLLQFLIIKEKVDFLIKSLLMVLLGLAVSSYFWLPAVVESNLMKYDTVFNFADHFPTLKQLIIPFWGYGASVSGPNDLLSFFLGTTQLLLVVFGMIISLLLWSKLKSSVKILVGWAFACLILAVFLMNFRSVGIWNSIPLIPYFQFPWRFLIITTFVIPLLVVLVENIKFRLKAAILIIILVLISTASYFRPQDFLGRQDSYFINRYIPTPIASLEYQKTQEEYLRLPKATQFRPDRNYPLVSAEEGKIEKVEKINDLDAKVWTNSIGGMKINYNKFFFPGWKAEVDGKTVAIKSGDPFGQIVVNVPAGSHILTVRFRETNFRGFLNAISLAGFLVSLGIALSLRLRI